MAKAMTNVKNTIIQINGMMNVKSLQKTGMELQKEMMQMGMINEMVEETLEEDEISDEADEIIDGIIKQVEDGTYDKN